MNSSSPAGSPPTPDLPGTAEILGYFAGASRMMLGHRDGLDRLDLSADGFWTSFFALVVALPPMALSWVEFEGLKPPPAREIEAGAAFTYAAHALADVLAWVLPVALLMTLASRLGLRRKIVPLVVATNWGNALLAWAMAPAELVVIASNGAPTAVGLAAFASLAALALMVRLIATALEEDLRLAVGITLLIVVTSLVSYGVMTDLTGIALI